MSVENTVVIKSSVERAVIGSKNPSMPAPEQGDRSNNLRIEYGGIVYGEGILVENADGSTLQNRIEIKYGGAAYALAGSNSKTAVKLGENAKAEIIVDAGGTINAANDASLTGIDGTGSESAAIVNLSGMLNAYGSTAFKGGSDDDIFNVHTGAVIYGDIDGGDGRDRVQFGDDTAGWTGTYYGHISNVEEIVFRGNSYVFFADTQYFTNPQLSINAVLNSYSPVYVANGIFEFTSDPNFCVNGQNVLFSNGVFNENGIYYSLIYQNNWLYLTRTTENVSNAVVYVNGDWNEKKDGERVASFGVHYIIGTNAFGTFALDSAAEKVSRYGILTVRSAGLHTETDLHTNATAYYTLNFENGYDFSGKNVYGSEATAVDDTYYTRNAAGKIVVVNSELKANEVNGFSNVLLNTTRMAEAEAADYIGGNLYFTGKYLNGKMPNPNYSITDFNFTDTADSVLSETATGKFESYVSEAGDISNYADVAILYGGKADDVSGGIINQRIYQLAADVNNERRGIYYLKSNYSFVSGKITVKDSETDDISGYASAFLTNANTGNISAKSTIETQNGSNAADNSYKIQSVSTQTYSSGNLSAESNVGLSQIQGNIEGYAGVFLNGYSVTGLVQGGTVVKTSNTMAYNTSAVADYYKMSSDSMNQYMTGTLTAKDFDIHAIANFASVSLGTGTVEYIGTGSNRNGTISSFSQTLLTKDLSTGNSTNKQIYNTYRESVSGTLSSTGTLTVGGNISNYANVTLNKLNSTIGRTSDIVANTILPSDFSTVGGFLSAIEIQNRVYDKNNSDSMTTFSTIENYTLSSGGSLKIDSLNLNLYSQISGFTDVTLNGGQLNAGNRNITIASVRSSGFGINYFDSAEERSRLKLDWTARLSGPVEVEDEDGQLGYVENASSIKSGNYIYANRYASTQKSAVGTLKLSNLNFSNLANGGDPLSLSGFATVKLADVANTKKITINGGYHTRVQSINQIYDTTRAGDDETKKFFQTNTTLNETRQSVGALTAENCGDFIATGYSTVRLAGNTVRNENASISGGSTSHYLTETKQYNSSLNLSGYFFSETQTSFGQGAVSGGNLKLGNTEITGYSYVNLENISSVSGSPKIKQSENSFSVNGSCKDGDFAVLNWNRPDMTRPGMHSSLSGNASRTEISSISGILNETVQTGSIMVNDSVYAAGNLTMTSNDMQSFSSLDGFAAVNLTNITTSTVRGGNATTTKTQTKQLSKDKNLIYTTETESNSNQVTGFLNMTSGGIDSVNGYSQVTLTGVSVSTELKGGSDTDYFSRTVQYSDSTEADSSRWTYFSGSHSQSQSGTGSFVMTGGMLSDIAEIKGFSYVSLKNVEFADGTDSSIKQTATTSTNTDYTLKRDILDNTKWLDESALGIAWSGFDISGCGNLSASDYGYATNSETMRFATRSANAFIYAAGSVIIENAMGSGMKNIEGFSQVSLRNNATDISFTIMGGMISRNKTFSAERDKTRSLAEDERNYSFKTSNSTESITSVGVLSVTGKGVLNDVKNMAIVSLDGTVGLLGNINLENNNLNQTENIYRAKADGSLTGFFAQVVQSVIGGGTLYNINNSSNTLTANSINISIKGISSVRLYRFNVTQEGTKILQADGRSLYGLGTNSNNVAAWKTEIPNSNSYGNTNHSETASISGTVHSRSLSDSIYSAGYILIENENKNQKAIDTIAGYNSVTLTAVKVKNILDGGYSAKTHSQTVIMDSEGNESYSTEIFSSTNYAKGTLTAKNSEISGDITGFYSVTLTNSEFTDEPFNIKAGYTFVSGSNVQRNTVASLTSIAYGTLTVTDSIKQDAPGFVTGFATVVLNNTDKNGNRKLFGMTIASNSSEERSEFISGMRYGNRIQTENSAGNPVEESVTASGTFKSTGYTISGGIVGFATVALTNSGAAWIIGAFTPSDGGYTYGNFQNGGNSITAAGSLVLTDSKVSSAKVLSVEDTDISIAGYNTLNLKNSRIFKSVFSAGCSNTSIGNTYRFVSRYSQVRKTYAVGAATLDSSEIGISGTGDLLGYYSVTLRNRSLISSNVFSADTKIGSDRFFGNFEENIGYTISSITNLHTISATGVFTIEDGSCVNGSVMGYSQVFVAGKTGRIVSAGYTASSSNLMFEGNYSTSFSTIANGSSICTKSVIGTGTFTLAKTGRVVGVIAGYYNVSIFGNIVGESYIASSAYQSESGCAYGSYSNTYRDTTQKTAEFVSAYGIITITGTDQDERINVGCSIKGYYTVAVKYANITREIVSASKSNMYGNYKWDADVEELKASGTLSLYKASVKGAIQGFSSVILDGSTSGLVTAAAYKIGDTGLIVYGDTEKKVLETGGFELSTKVSGMFSMTGGQLGEEAATFGGIRGFSYVEIKKSDSQGPIIWGDVIGGDSVIRLDTDGEIMESERNCFGTASVSGANIHGSIQYFDIVNINSSNLASVEHANSLTVGNPGICGMTSIEEISDVRNVTLYSVENLTILEGKASDRGGLTLTNSDISLTSISNFEKVALVNSSVVTSSSSIIGTLDVDSKSLFGSDQYQWQVEHITGSGILIYRSGSLKDDIIDERLKCRILGNDIGEENFDDTEENAIELYADDTNWLGFGDDTDFKKFTIANGEEKKLQMTAGSDLVIGTLRKGTTVIDSWENLSAGIYTLELSKKDSGEMNAGYALSLA